MYYLSISYVSPIARTYVCLFALLLGVWLFSSCDKDKSTPDTPTYKLTIATLPTGGTIVGHEITYKKDEVTNITVKAYEGYTFSKWTGVPKAQETENPLKLKMTKDITLGAVFTQNKVETPTYTLTLTPPTGGKVEGNKATYDKDELTDILATAADGYYFTRWTGVPDANKTDNPLKLKMTENITLGVVFTQKKTGVNHTLTLATIKDGTVTGNKDKYANGETTDITASPLKKTDAFSHWTGVPESYKHDNPLRIPVTQDLTLGAVFGAAITLDANGKTLKAPSFAKGGEKYTYNDVEYTIAADKDALLAALKAGEDMSKYITTKVTDMKRLFIATNKLNGDISAWDVSNVTDMTAMFAASLTFNQDISAWDVSKVTNMKGMFSQAFVFNQDLSKWDVSQVTDMSSMFYQASAFNGDISGWNVGKVTDMHAMFVQATAFNGDLRKWDVSKVTDMEYMFTRASAFNQNIGKWDVGKVSGMKYMFSGASSFNQDLSGWCVSQITSTPADFDSLTSEWKKTGRLPKWGAKCSSK